LAEYPCAVSATACVSGNDRNGFIGHAPIDQQIMRITSGWDRSVPAGRAIIIVKPAIAEAEPA
jgi:hypothetical protein